MTAECYLIVDSAGEDFVRSTVTDNYRGDDCLNLLPFIALGLTPWLLRAARSFARHVNFRIVGTCREPRPRVRPEKRNPLFNNLRDSRVEGQCRRLSRTPDRAENNFSFKGKSVSSKHFFFLSSTQVYYHTYITICIITNRWVTLMESTDLTN